MDHELMTMWLSVDPLADKYPGISPYAYCVWNPVKLVDPDGRDWYRNDKTGSVFWSSKSDRKIEYNGESYRNIGTSYKTYKDGFIFQYGNSIDDVSISEVSESEKQFYMDGGQFIPSTFYTDDGSKVNVSFLYNSETGGNGDKPLNPEMVSALIQAVNIVNNGNDKIKKIDISTTTTGKHSKNSSHYICNGARAVDIDIINNTSLRKTSSHSLATKLQCAFDQLGVTNYGPAHNQLQGHDNHIHANIKKSDNMFLHFRLNKLMIIFFFLPFANVFAQDEIQYIPYDSISKIGFIDKSIEDAEIESYDIVVINSHLKGTTTLCRDVLYVDSSAVELIGSQFYFISHENLIVYNMETAICDTIFRNIDGLNINAFCLIPENLAVVASVNYKTEDITFSVLDLTFNKILWNCNINETNVGLEYLRITMQGAGSDCIDVSTNQYDYCISLSEEICKKKN